MSAAVWHARGRRLDLATGPAVMGIVNASPDSFSDGSRVRTLDGRLRLAEELVAAGADLLDVGGQSAITGVPEVEAAEEAERVVPLIERLTAEIDVPLSVDTYRPVVAQAAIDAGAAIVNDVSGLRHAEVADICARSGAGLVVMHTRAAPKQRLADPALYEDVAADVVSFLRERVAEALRRGVRREQIALDPGPDFSKTPAQTVEALRSLSTIRALGHPVLLALSRKDFIGAITGRRPLGRLAGTLAAVGSLGDVPGTILRVHDVAEVRDYLAVRAALDGRRPVAADLVLDPALRREAG